MYPLCHFQLRVTRVELKKLVALGVPHQTVGKLAALQRASSSNAKTSPSFGSEGDGQ